jgi:hypothetical protein
MKRPENRKLIPPEGIIPFGLTQEQARNALYRWLKTKKLYQQTQTAAPAGLYVPIWTFDVGGQIEWRERAVETHHTRIKSVTQTNSRAIFFDDILVPASHKFTNLAGEFRHYQLDQVVPYESGYLADWPAETYQISTANASLKARQQGFAQAQQQVRERTIAFADQEELSFSSANITIESYKLILLPVWLTYYFYQDKKYNVFINGQTGRIKGASPRSKAKKWWDKFWGNE